MRLALVHDYLNQFGGAERVIAALHELYPAAPIYTSIYNENNLPAVFKNMDIRTSFMQKLPLVNQLFKWYLLLYPLAFESFDLSAYDVILSSSSAWAKGVKKQPGQVHICYCYTPMRFVWRYDDYVKRENFHPLIKAVLPVVLAPLKQWDLKTAATVDHFLAISQTVANRIKLTYGRESDIIYPPVETDKFSVSNIDQDYFLVVSRLNYYKRIDLVVAAFNELGLPLKIIGSGPALNNLKQAARENIEFLGQQSDAEIAQAYAECRALIFPGVEDFGLTPVEAMSAGRPVIAFAAGGATETIITGKTGLFFTEQTAASLIKAIQQFQFSMFDKQIIRQQALKFDRKVFQTQIDALLRAKVREAST